MAKQLPSVDTNADTFYSWIVKTNGLVQLCNTEVVTANNAANGAVTTGMGYVIGTFGANTVVASELRGGNTISSAIVNITSNAIFTANTVTINPGVSLGVNQLVHHQGLRFIATTLGVNQVVDSFSSTAYRTAKYVISVFSPSTTSHQTTEILVLNDGTQTYMTEYATVYSGSPLATFSTDVSNNAVRLLTTPITPIQINIARTLIAA